MALKSTAELSLLVNKMTDINNEIESLDRQINEQHEDLKKKQETIKQLSEEIKELKDDIRNEDVKIAERENNIFKLKKKTHELSQFKFVLDFKIRDLREDITPRQIETEKLRQETNAKDQELQQYNNLNAKLGFIVEKLRNQQDNLQAAIKLARSQIGQNESYIRAFKNAVYWVAQNIDDYEKLKASVHRELMRYVNKEQGVKNQEENNEIQQEQKSQLNYLVNCVKQLRQRLDKERLAHKMDNQEVMEKNTQLIKEIGELREEIEGLKAKFNNNDVGGIRNLTVIMKRREERDRMLEQLEQQEKNGTASKSLMEGSL